MSNAPTSGEIVSDSSPDSLIENEGNVLISAGPGTGKTQFLAKRAICLLRTGKVRTPQRILAISFTRDAERSLTDRVRVLDSGNYANRFQSMTFDSFSKGIVDRFGELIDVKWRPDKNYSIRAMNDDEIIGIYRECGGRRYEQQKFENRLSVTDIWNIQECGSLNEDIRQFWKKCYSHPDGMMLTFSMINRLAKNILVSSKIVLRAIRKTFPVVFVDELQDTSEAQYELLNETFPSDAVCVTAVGDKNQRILGWAGAKDDIFSSFENDYSPTVSSLNKNRRTHSEMINLQHGIVSVIDKSAQKPIATIVESVEKPFSALLKFRNGDEEARAIATWIGGGVQKFGWQSKCIAILARKNTLHVEKGLLKHFTKESLQIRDVGHRVGRITVRELLNEHITNMVISTLRVGAARACPEAWSSALMYLAKLRGVGYQSEREGRMAQKHLQECVRNVRKIMEIEFNESQVQAALKYVLKFWENENIRHTFPAYRRRQDLERFVDGVRCLLLEGVPNASSWSELLDWFEGNHQVPLMTIHKSKGMEFERVVVLGVDDARWGDLTIENEDELKLLYVALTRARKGVYFTCLDNYRGGKKSLEDVFSSCGVECVSGSELINMPW